MSKQVLKIEFSNQSALDHFARWLCEMGEQDYWDYMEYREKKEDGNITAVSFSYSEKVNLENGKTRFEWLKDNTIKTTCSRLDKEE